MKFFHLLMAKANTEKFKKEKRSKKGKKQSRKEFLLGDLQEKFEEENKEEERTGKTVEATLELEGNERYDNTLKLAVFLIFAGILGLGGFFFYASSRSKIKSDTVTVKNFELPRTGDERGEVYEYYSPSLDLILHYDSEEFDVSDNHEGVFISLKESPTTSAWLKVLSKDNEEVPIDSYSSYYQELHPDTSVTRTEEGDNELTYLELNFTETYTFKQELTQGIYHTIIIRPIEDGYISLDITEKGGTAYTQKLLKDFENILLSVGVAPVNLTEVAEVSLKDGDVKVAYDRDKWVVVNEEKDSLELTFRSKEYEQDEELINNYTSFEISAQSNLSEEATENLLLEQLEAELNNVKENYADFSLEILSEPSSKTTQDIDEVKFYSMKYQYTWYESENIVTRYLGYDEPSSLIEITTIEKDPKSVGSEELATLLSQVKIVKNETEENISAYVKNYNVLGIDISEIQKSTIIGKPSVVNIFNKSCVKLSIEKDTDLPTSSGRSYTLCSLGFGTGFFVNKEGYLASNAHVVAPNPLDIAVDGLLYGEDKSNLDRYLGSDAVVLASELYPEYDVGNNLEDPEVADLVEGLMVSIIVIGEDEEIVKLSDVSYENYVQSEEPFKLNEKTCSLENPKSYLSTELIANRKIESVYAIGVSNLLEEEAGFQVPDVAIIKVVGTQNVSEFPTIRLSDYKKLSVGTPISVIGFPGSAEDEDIFSKEAALVPTITSGTISAIKPSFGNEFELIQIDASISHGNSGGPIINSDGELVGVATYILSLEGSADFNAGVSVKEVSSLMEEKGLENDVGRGTILVEEGLDDFTQRYYKWAINNFNEAKSINSTTADVLDPIILTAQERIDNGEDNTPAVTIGDDIFIHKKELIIIGVAGTSLVGGIVLLIFLIVIKLLFGRKRRKKIQEQAMTRSVENIQPPSVQNSQQNTQSAKPDLETQPQVAQSQTEVEQVMHNVPTQDTHQPRPSVSDAQRAYADGVKSSDMIPEPDLHKKAHDLEDALQESFERPQVMSSPVTMKEPQEPQEKAASENETEVKSNKVTSDVAPREVKPQQTVTETTPSIQGPTVTPADQKPNISSGQPTSVEGNLTGEKQSESLQGIQKTVPVGQGNPSTALPSTSNEKASPKKTNRPSGV